jgi:hypothetical protein
MCNDCGTYFSVTLRYDQVDDEPPDCPRCAVVMQQDFKPVAVHGVKAQDNDAARKRALDIAVNDLGVENINIEAREGSTPKVTYKNQPPTPPSNWVGPNVDMLNGAMREGRIMRQQHGSGLDVLAHNLSTGAQPDLIEVSKRRSMKVW